MKLLLALLLTGCCYTHTSERGAFTQVAVFNNIEQTPGSYKQTVSGEMNGLAAIAGAVWIKSAAALAFVGVPPAAKSAVEVLSKPADNLTTITAPAGKGN